MDDRQRKDKRKYYNQRCKRKSLAGLMDNTEDRNMWRNMSVHVYWHGTWWKWWRRDKAISFLMNQPIAFRKTRVQLLNQTFIIVLFCVLLGWQGLHFFFSTEHVPSSLTCNQCNATFHNAQNFTAHMTLHSESLRHFSVSQSSKTENPSKCVNNGESGTGRK